MSKKTSQNGYKSDSTDTTSSNSDLDKCEKTSNTNFLFSEFQKHESTTSRKFQRHGNGSKIKKVSDNETNQIFTSETSLNEDLYGTSDKYNDTLQKLKSKLHSLHLDLPTNNKINTTGNLCCEDHYKDEDFRFDINFKISNFLFDKETNTSTTNFRKKPSLDTIYKENKQESSYLPADTQIHVSKVIEEMDEQTNPDANISTSAFSSMEILSILEPVEMRSTSTWCSSPQDCASPLLYAQEDYIPRRHFVVDLPSSVEGDYTSSDNFTVTPSIITLDNDKKSKRLYKKRNKVAPSPQSASSSSASLSNDSKRLKQLLLRYLNDTPLISSNSTSTPPPILSTQASGSATETTVKSKVDLLSNVSTNTMNSSTIYSSQQLSDLSASI
ncbi:hypothetical protein FQR65_LT04773 [Abscondita terminalis]|nr:hypothetical protein FQR65_LT04773 [Abscondita terminalis]